MRKVFYLFAILGLILMTSCARGCASFEKDFQVGKRNYTVQMYSGGQVVFTDQVRTIINDSQGSDGIYYTNEYGQLVEISGDYILVSTD